MRDGDMPVPEVDYARRTTYCSRSKVQEGIVRVKIMPVIKARSDSAAVLEENAGLE
jgi:hypothetical protein